MRNFKLNLSFLLFVYLISVYASCGGTNYGYYSPNNTPGNDVRFKYTNTNYLPVVEDYQTSGFLYMLYANGIPSWDDNPVRQYRTNVIDNTYGEIIPIKNPGDPPIAYFEDVNITASDPSFPVDQYFEGWKDPAQYSDNLLRTNFSYTPRCGDTVTYLISFKPCSDESVLSVEYNANQMTYIEPVMSPLLRNNSTLIQGSPKEVRYSFSGLSRGTSFTYGLRFYMACDGQANGVFEANTSYKGKSEGKTVCAANDTTSYTALTEGNPFDPNHLTPDRTCVNSTIGKLGDCRCHEESINYEFYFQNEGTGPAKNNIDLVVNVLNTPCNDFTLELTGYDSTLFNGVQGSIVHGNSGLQIIFNNTLKSPLRGTKERINGQRGKTYAFNDPLTIGFVKFRIILNEHCCIKNSKITLQGSVVFDTMPPVLTHMENVYICNEEICPKKTSKDTPLDKDKTDSSDAIKDTSRKMPK